MKKKSLSMEVINRYAAGIDVSSLFHYVAIGQNPQDARKFGVYNEDLKKLLQWLQENKITTVVMESIGTYWQSLFSFLQEAGLEVFFCNGQRVILLFVIDSLLSYLFN